MRIVHIVTAFPRDEGDPITPWLGRLILAQRTAGDAPAVLAPAYRGGGATEWRGIPVRRFRYAPRALETLTHEETVPDRLRSRPPSAALVPAYMCGGTIAAWREGLRRPDVVHVHWPFPHAWFGAVARAASGGRTAVVSTFYSVELRWVARRLPALAPLLAWSVDSADLVTAISTATARAVEACAGRPVRVIPFAAAVGDDPGSGAAGRTRRDPARPFELLFVGRLVERKGVDVLIRALRRLGERLPAVLRVVGEGPESSRLRVLARELGVEDRVTFEGRVDARALADAYRSADVFVLPAIVDAKGDTEGLGVVLLEALAFGVPVVASNAGGIPDIVRDGETGWLTRRGDPGALADAILDVARRPEEAARRVAAGRTRMETRFSVEGIVAALRAAYVEAIDRRLGRSRAAGAGAPRGADRT